MANLAAVFLSVTRDGISLHTRGKQISLQDGHRIFQGSLKLVCTHDQSPSIFADFNGTFRTISHPALNSIKETKYTLDALSVTLEGVDVIVDTRKCPMVLKDVRIFDGVFRVACPDVHHGTCRLAASFRGTVMTPLPAVAGPNSAKIDTLKDRNAAQRPSPASSQSDGETAEACTERKQTRSVEPAPPGAGQRPFRQGALSRPTAEDGAADHKAASGLASRTRTARATAAPRCAAAAAAAAAAQLARSPRGWWGHGGVCWL